MRDGTHPVYMNIQRKLLLALPAQPSVNYEKETRAAHAQTIPSTLQ